MSDDKPTKVTTAADAQKILAKAPRPPKGMDDLKKMAEEGRDKKEQELEKSRQESAEYWADGAEAAKKKPKPGQKIKPVGTDPNSQAYSGDVHPIMEDVFSPMPEDHPSAPDPDDLPEIPEMSETDKAQIHHVRAQAQSPVNQTVKTREPTDEELKQRGYVKISREVSNFEQFRSQRSRATINIEGGTFSIPVIGLNHGEYCIAVFTPLDDNGIVFVPSSGTELSITHDGKTYKAYYPGSYTEVTELGIGVMHLIRADKE